LAKRRRIWTLLNLDGILAENPDILSKRGKFSIKQIKVVATKLWSASRGYTQPLHFERLKKLKTLILIMCMDWNNGYIEDWNCGCGDDSNGNGNRCSWNDPNCIAVAQSFPMCGFHHLHMCHSPAHLKTETEHRRFRSEKRAYENELILLIGI